MYRKDLAPPIAALVALSLGGLILHARTHPVSLDPANPSNPANVVPLVLGAASVVAAPILLSFARTFVVGYLLNGMSAVVGAVAMASISVAHPPAPLTAASLVTDTMLSSVLLLAPKLFLGQIVLRIHRPGGMGRLFTAAWWTRHVVYVGAVFAIGRLLWR